MRMSCLREAVSNPCTVTIASSFECAVAPSELDHLEIVLARAAFGAGPVRRNVFPAGAGRDAVFRRSDGLVVDPAADQAHVFFHRAKRVMRRPKAGGPMRTSDATCVG